MEMKPIKITFRRIWKFCLLQQTLESESGIANSA